jgi:hypothetical protein
MQLTVSVWAILGFIGFGAFIIVAGIVVGAFLVFKTFNARPGEGLLGGVPKGQVFSIPDPLDGQEEENLEANLLKRTSQFLSSFGGGKNES